MRKGQGLGVQRLFAAYSLPSRVRRWWNHEQGRCGAASQAEGPLIPDMAGMLEVTLYKSSDERHPAEPHILLVKTGPACRQSLALRFY